MQNTMKLSSLVTQLQNLEYQRCVASKKRSRMQLGFGGLTLCFAWIVQAPVNIYFFGLLLGSLSLVQLNKENSFGQSDQLSADIEALKKQIDKIEDDLSKAS